MDACENRWLKRIIQITNETMRQEDTTGTSVQQDQTDAIWLGHVIPMKDDRLTKSVHQWNPTGKRSRAIDLVT